MLIFANWSIKCSTYLSLSLTDKKESLPVINDIVIKMNEIRRRDGEEKSINNKTVNEKLDA